MSGIFPTNVVNHMRGGGQIWPSTLPYEIPREMFCQLKFWVTLSLGFCGGEVR